MADIGTLVVRMAADSAKMRTDLDRVQKKLRETTSITAGLSSSFGRLGAVVGGVSLVALVNQALQAAEALQNVSIQTGISTDALQRLQFAAGLSGASLDQVSGAVTKMQRALVTSGEGSQQAQEALARLGLTTSDLLALAPDKQFERIAVAIASIDDPAQRATAAVGLFGRSGAELLPTLTALGENAATVNQQFAELGGPVSEQAIAGVDTFGDSLDTLKVAAKNLGIEILALVSGPLTALADNLRQNIGELRALAGSGGEMEQLERRMRTLQDMRTDTVGSTMVGEFGGGFALQGMFARTENGVIAVRRQIAGLEQDAIAAAFKLEEVRVDLPDPQVPNFGAPVGGKKGAPSKPEMSPADRRAAADAEMAAGLSLDAGLYQAKELALDQHLLNVAMAESQSAIERMRIASDLEYFRADVAQAFGLQTLDFETIKNQSVLDLAGELFTALGGESSKLFKIQKTFAIANAIIGTAEGITQALKLPFPANLAAAAKVAAAGAIQIAKIKATNPGGGGGASPSISGGGGGGGAAGQSLPDRVPALEQQAPQRIAQVVVQGNLFSGRETADWLIEQLSDAVNNRDVVFINGASRQAGAISESA